MDNDATTVDVDVIAVGAGMAGLYLLHKMRELGFSATVLEAADDVGGTWYWNRYPGARCDVESIDYSFSFDEALQQEWEWSERYATQPEILRYIQHVADRFELRRDIQFETAVAHAEWNDVERRWHVTTETGDTMTCRWYVMATGCLSVPKAIDIDGADSFAGPTYVTGRWPHSDVDFTGRRVAVIGTGSSAIQAIPLIAEQASSVTVFQRTANYSIPARNRPTDPAEVAAVKANYGERREAARWSRGGVPLPLPIERVLDVPVDERNRRLESVWQDGHLLGISALFTDIAVNPEANEAVAEFVRNKVRGIVTDPVTAELLCAKEFPIFTKRLCLDTNYYETFNHAHVRLVDLRSEPISSISESGVHTSERSFEVDDIVFATGFDAMTGAIVAVDIKGRNGIELRDVWADGPKTYLGLTIPEFPNLFMITGPQSPSVLSNMMVSIEQHVEWIADCLVALRDDGFDVIEATETAGDGWNQHATDCAEFTLFNQADSWYMGANVPGKPRVLLPYLGGVSTYRETCDRVTEQDYLGFRRSGPGGERCNDGIVNRLQPDVSTILGFMSQLELPPIDSMAPDQAREFMAASAASRPPGPEVGEIVDGTYQGAATDLDYRLYRPATPGPHAVMLYFHGGGWVLGSAESDDPFCRYLCANGDVIVVSVNYRHAPEARFPAPVDDAWAALQWIGGAAAGFGGDPDRILVGGWSAGANLAAVVAQRARDAGDVKIAAQMLINPATDSDLNRTSFVENADGYVLTRSLMTWFWDHYCDDADRGDPRAAPLRADSLAGLPQALVVTAEFDPLRDEGNAYANALNAAGSPAQLLELRGQIHTSVTSVGMVLSAEKAREEIAAVVSSFAR